MKSTSNLFPGSTASGMLVVIATGVSFALWKDLSFEAILGSDIRETLYGTTLFAFFAIFVFTLVSSLLGRVLAWPGFYLADKCGRNRIYREFNERKLSPDLALELDKLVSKDEWAATTGLSEDQRYFLLLTDHLAALDFDLYSKVRRSQVAPTALLRNVATAFLFSSLPLALAWACGTWPAWVLTTWHAYPFVTWPTWACGTFLASILRFGLGVGIGGLAAWLILRFLYLRSLEKEMSRLLRVYLVLTRGRPQTSPATQPAGTSSPRFGIGIVIQSD